MFLFPAEKVRDFMANLKQVAASSLEEDLKKEATTLLESLQKKKPDACGDIEFEVASGDLREVVMSGDCTETGYNRTVDFLKRRREKRIQPVANHLHPTMAASTSLSSASR